MNACHKCVCLRRPEEGDRVPEAEVTGHPGLPGIGAGEGGVKLGSSRRAANANIGAISPAPQAIFL